MTANRETGWLRRPISRRTTVRLGAAGTGLAGLYLAACGGGQKQETGDTAAKSELRTATVQAATTKQPKPGGSVSSQYASAPPSLDPYTQTSFIMQSVGAFTFSKLLRFKTGVPEVVPSDFTMEPDLAQNMPQQTDPQTLTFKLKHAK